MENITVYGSSLPNAYHHVLENLVRFGVPVPCPDWDTECKELDLTMVVYEPLDEPRISLCAPCGPRELEQYRLEMLDGILDWAVGAGKEPYTYHNRIKRQLPRLVEELKRNPYTRRAVIQVSNRHDFLQNDPPCLNHLQYFIREGKLDCHALFRSNDAVKATFMNAFALICLQERIATEVGVPVGKYVHHAQNFHAYQRDWDLLKAYANNPRSANFKGDWDEMMAAEREDILKTMDELRARSEEDKCTVL